VAVSGINGSDCDDAIETFVRCELAVVFTACELPASGAEPRQRVDRAAL
jgi:hypothetical protein